LVLINLDYSLNNFYLTGVTIMFKLNPKILENIRNKCIYIYVYMHKYPLWKFLY